MARKASADEPLRCAILISGTGSWMEKLLSHQQNTVACSHKTVIVISDKADAAGLDKAKNFAIETAAIELSDQQDPRFRREEHEQRITQAIEQSGAELVVLSGYMRILSAGFVDRWAPNLINIHPSLLPAFPGGNAHRDVIASNVEVSGCTVHFVDSGVDSGAIIAQCRVPRLPDDDVVSLGQRVRVEEHIIYPRVIDAIAQGRVFLSDNKVTLSGEI